MLSVRYERTSVQLSQTLELLLNHESLILHEPDVVRRAIATSRVKPSIGLADLLMLEHARQYGHGPMATFDRSFAKVDGALRLGRPRAD